MYWEKLQHEVRVRAVQLWLRDDDACRNSAQLQRLIEITEDIPISLAVIPGRLETSLVDTLKSRDNISVLQHGYRHENHDGEAQQRCEFPDTNLKLQIINDLSQGMAILEDAFGPQFNRVFVPPWNRFSSKWLDVLPQYGYEGFSAHYSYGDNGPVQTHHVHVDILARPQQQYRGDQHVIGEELLSKHIGHHTSPIGIMTHHMAHDEACWAFLEKLVQLDHIEWVNPFAR